LLLENLLAPIESKEANATNVNATCEDPAARSLLEARMEESVTSIQARCSVLELRIKEQVKFTAKSEANMCERFTKSISAMSNCILESSQELTKGVATEFARRFDKITKLVATLDARLVIFEQVKTIPTAASVTLPVDRHVETLAKKTTTDVFYSGLFVMKRYVFKKTIVSEACLDSGAPLGEEEDDEDDPFAFSETMEIIEASDELIQGSAFSNGCMQPPPLTCLPAQADTQIEMMHDSRSFLVWQDLAAVAASAQTPLQATISMTQRLQNSSVDNSSNHVHSHVAPESHNIKSAMGAIPNNWALFGAKTPGSVCCTSACSCKDPQ
jgi:hypothetical protein